MPAKIIKGRLELDLEDVYNNPKKYFPPILVPKKHTIILS